VGYLCAKFGLPRPLCSRVKPNVHDGQTDVRQKHRLCPRLFGAGHNKKVNYRKQNTRHVRKILAIGVVDPEKNFPHIQFDRQAKFGRCFSYCVRASMRALGPRRPFGIGGVADQRPGPKKYAYRHLCYHAISGHSRSNDTSAVPPEEPEHPRPAFVGTDTDDRLPMTSY